uniref:Uncharacterized protein n=1 Tax=Salix viminalis TaxID=40686 RepID=A0A6N2LEV8_SALVM
MEYFNCSKVKSRTKNQKECWATHTRLAFFSIFLRSGGCVVEGSSPSSAEVNETHSTYHHHHTFIIRSK